MSELIVRSPSAHSLGHTYHPRIIKLPIKTQCTIERHVVCKARSPKVTRLCEENMQPFISQLHSSPDYSTEFQVRTLLCSNLGLSVTKVNDMLTLPEVCRTMETIPKYEAHLKFMVMMLTMQIGVDRATLNSLVAQHPTFLLSQAPFLKDNLRELRRALAFHFDIFLKTSADELPETWRAMLRQRPDLLLLDPERAEAVLRWLSMLAKAASLETDTATAFIKCILVISPEVLNQKVRLMQYDANQVWWLAKERRCSFCGGGGGHGGDTNISTSKASIKKRNLVGEAAKARFILAYTALRADILKNEELKPLQGLQAEIQQCLADMNFSPLHQNNIKVR